MVRAHYRRGRRTRSEQRLRPLLHLNGSSHEATHAGNRWESRQALIQQGRGEYQDERETDNHTFVMWHKSGGPRVVLYFDSDCVRAGKHSASAVS